MRPDGGQGAKQVSHVIPTALRTALETWAQGAIETNEGSRDSRQLDNHHALGACCSQENNPCDTSKSSYPLQ